MKDAEKGKSRTCPRFEEVPSVIFRNLLYNTFVYTFFILHNEKENVRSNFPAFRNAMKKFRIFALARGKSSLLAKIFSLTPKKILLIYFRTLCETAALSRRILPSSHNCLLILFKKAKNKRFKWSLMWLL